MMIKTPIAAVPGLMLTALLITSLAGCAAAQVDKDAQLPTTDKSIVVIGVPIKGVHSDEAKLLFWPGSVEEGVFKKSSSGGAAIMTPPANGYIVAEVDSGDTLALGDIYVAHDKEHAAGQSSEGTSHFKPGNGMKTAVFDVPGGKVIYIGDIDLDVSLPGPHDFGDGALKLSPSSNFAAAKEYIDAHYPGLKGNLEEQPFKVEAIRFSAMEVISVIPVVQSALNPAWAWSD